MIYESKIKITSYRNQVLPVYLSFILIFSVIPVIYISQVDFAVEGAETASLSEADWYVEDINDNDYVQDISSFELDGEKYIIATGGTQIGSEYHVYTAVYVINDENELEIICNYAKDLDASSGYNCGLGVRTFKYDGSTKIAVSCADCRGSTNKIGLLIYDFNGETLSEDDIYSNYAGGSGTGGARLEVIELDDEVYIVQVANYRGSNYDIYSIVYKYTLTGIEEVDQVSYSVSSGTTDNVNGLSVAFYKGEWKLFISAHSHPATHYSSSDSLILVYNFDGENLNYETRHLYNYGSTDRAYDVETVYQEGRLYVIATGYNYYSGGSYENIHLWAYEYANGNLYPKQSLFKSVRQSEQGEDISIYETDGEVHVFLIGHGDSRPASTIDMYIGYYTFDMGYFTEKDYITKTFSNGIDWGYALHNDIFNGKLYLLAGGWAQYAAPGSGDFDQVLGLYETGIEVAPVVKDWTFMVYMCADNDLEELALNDFEEMAEIGSDGNLNIIVQLDLNCSESNDDIDWDTCKRFHITKNMEPISSNAISDLGEVNMGSDFILKDFIEWGISTYPAEKYSLIIWDHGKAWEGCCKDDHGNFVNDEWETDGLYTKEIDEALGTDSPIDVIGFHACLMGNIETAYQIHDSGIDYMVASEEKMVEPKYNLLNFGYSFYEILYEIQTNPEMTGIELSKCMVDEYNIYDINPINYIYNQTISAIDLNKIDDLATELDNFADTLIDYWSDDPDSVISAAEDLKNYFDTSDVIIYEKHHILNSIANGISIYLPIEPISPKYDNFQEINLLSDTSWDEFVNDFVDEMSFSWIYLARNDSQLFEKDHEMIDLYEFCDNIANFKSSIENKIITFISMIEDQYNLNIYQGLDKIVKKIIDALESAEEYSNQLKDHLESVMENLAYKLIITLIKMIEKASGDELSDQEVENISQMLEILADSI